MESPSTILLYIMIFLAILVILTKLYRYQRLKHYDEVPVRDVSRGHRWVMVETFCTPTYCNINQDLILHGAKCDSCGVCVDDHNMKVADKTIPCKPLSVKPNSMTHHWVEGNLSTIKDCVVCNEYCGEEDVINDLQCAWCNVIVHKNCVNSLGAVCNLGVHKTAIIPPNCVTLKQVGFKGRRHFIVNSVRHPEIKNWSPVIVIANRKSGNNYGEFLLQSFRRLLNPAQVIDLHDLTPETGLEWCHLLPEVPCRVIVCGGDGTVGWVLNSIENLNLKTPTYVRVVPLGTGNDLSQVLGFGEEFNVEQTAAHILEGLGTCVPVKLDRWNVQIANERRFGLRMRNKKTVKMNNYMSLGVDAHVTLNFHKRRESWPSLFTNRLFNKFTYFTYGFHDVWGRQCKYLNKKLHVELDGVRVDLPDVEGVVVLNISSWGGGTRPWVLPSDDLCNYEPARYDDGLLEVMALYSSFHIAQLRIGMAQPLRLGQARHVKLTVHGGNVPMQVDGEPWIQHPADITVTFSGQAALLASESVDI